VQRADGARRQLLLYYRDNALHFFIVIRIQDAQLKRFVIDSGLVPRAELEAGEEAAKKSNKTLAETLVSAGALTDDDLRRIESYVLGIPFVSLKGKKIEFAILSLIPEPVARNHNIVAFKRNVDSLEVAMLDTADLPAIDFMKKKLDLKVLPRLTDTDSMKHALRQYQKTLKDEFGDIIMKETAALSPVAEGEGENLSKEDLEKMAEDLPVVRIIDTLLRHAITQGASDIHIEPMETEVLVRYRIDGILHDAMTLPKHAAPTLVARIKVLANLKLDEKRLPQDGRFKMEMEGQKVSFRVSVMPVYNGEKVVMRLLREGRAGFTLEGIGLHGQGLERIHDATRHTTGIVLVTGPTGSGKTTTLYTILDLMNTPEVNISTIEDPIEYQIPRINQTQVRPDIGFSFANGLRSLMRQDPDVIMVGEIRDSETASLAINASLTGHVVLATVHTNSAAATVARLVDMGVEPFLLASTLSVAVGQRLVRKLCEPKETYTLAASERANLEKHVDLERVLAALKEEKKVAKNATWNSIPFYRPTPSTDCEDGYKGRVGIHEVLPISSAMKELIMRSGTADDIEKQARAEGMLTMIEDGIYKAAIGVTTVEEVLRVISE
jgi:type IV pilus assembly protein PilB